MKTVYINGIVLDGSENMQPKTGLAIVTEGEKIAAVEPCQAVYHAGADQSACSSASQWKTKEKAEWSEEISKADDKQ